MPTESGPAVAAIVIGVTLLSLLAFLAAGMTFLGRYRRVEAATLQARSPGGVSEGLAGLAAAYSDLRYSTKSVVSAALKPRPK